MRGLRLLSLIFAALLAVPASARLPAEGDLAPDASLTMIDGSKVTLSSLRGQVVVLNFWATWCVPCRQELPLLDTYADIQRPRGLRVFAATTEDSLPLFRLRKIFAAMRLTPVRKIGGPYKEVVAVPMNYVIDRTGRIRYAKAGAFDLDTLNKVIVPLLGEPAAPGSPTN